MGVSPFFFSVVAEDDGTPLDVLAVELWGDELNQRFSEVRLVTKPQTPGRRYVVTAQGQRDLHDNVNHGSTAAFSAWVLTPGFVLYERYDGITGYSTTNLTGALKYPHHPDFIAYLNEWETPHDVGDQYGARLSGLVVPPVNGEYQFYLTASDQAFMYLASESGPATMEHVASAWIWASYREWTPGRSGEREPPQPRPPQSMIAGEPRYLEALLKEESHTDYMVATWRAPGESVPPNGSPSRLTGPVIAAWADPEGAGVELLSQPDEMTVIEGQPASISFQARGWTWLTNDSILAYQWQRDGVNIQLGNQAAWVIPRPSLADDGAHFRCEFWAPATHSLFTDEILLRVLPDTIPPRLLSATQWFHSGSYDVLNLYFDEPLDPASLLDPTNYRVFIQGTGQELTVWGVELPHIPAGQNLELRNVLLTVTAAEGSPVYDVHLRNVRDTSAAGNVVAPGEAFAPRLRLEMSLAPPRLRWNRYGDNRLLQSTGRLGPDAHWTNEPASNLSPSAGEHVLPAGGPDKYYRLKLD